MKRLIRILSALVGLLLVAVLALYAASTLRLSRTFEVNPPRLPIPDDAASIAQGNHLLTLAKCGECHGDDYGGKVILDEPFLARLSGPNLTPAGPVGTRSDAELLQAIRFGLSVDGRPLLGMPTAEHFHFSDDEMASMMAAIRALEPVHREVPL
jgi:mono/diheme cytochrome c family protein